MSEVYTESNLQLFHERLAWDEIVKYIFNISGYLTLSDKLLCEIQTGKKSSLNELHIIGSTCYSHNAKQCRKKLVNKAVKWVLAGYDGTNRYRLQCIENNRLIRSVNVIF